jgi:hypothetical protein
MNDRLAHQLRRLESGIKRVYRSTRPELTLAEVRRLMEVTEQLEIAAVRLMREKKYTWRQIGVLYGFTPQWACQKFSPGEVLSAD